MCKEYVIYKSFDELPEELKEKFKSGRNTMQTRGGYIGFVNLLSQRGDELVGDYVSALVKTQVKFGKCSHVSIIKPNDYKNGNGCGICKGLQVQQGVNDLVTSHPHLIKEWHPTRNNGITPYDATQGSHKKVWWQCSRGHEWEATICNRASKNSSCPFCSSKKVLKGFNDIATTHPQYIKYFVNAKDAHDYSFGSGKKVELRCPNCGHIKSMVIGVLAYRSFPCPLCSDGYSFPEKLIASVLTKLNIEFTKQMSYDNGEHKYDFYLQRYNAILEAHGLQHYGNGFKGLGGRTLEEEQRNDRYKRELAISNGIPNENYHEVDCRYSTLEWCRPNIEKALSNYVNMSILTEEDWKQADIQAQKSLKIEVCKYWKDNKDTNSNLTPQQVADVFGIDNATVWRYLKWGDENGLCNYESGEELKTHHQRRSKLVYLVKPDGGKWFEEAMSMNKLAKLIGIVNPVIVNNLDKGALKYRRNSKYDPKYIGSRIVSAEVYDSQNQTNQNT